MQLCAANLRMNLCEGVHHHLLPNTDKLRVAATTMESLRKIRPLTFLLSRLKGKVAQQ